MPRSGSAALASARPALLSAFLLGACGDRNVTIRRADPEPAASPEVSGVPESPSAEPPAAPTAGIAEEAGVSDRSQPEIDRLARAVGDVLATRCAPCHGEIAPSAGLGQLSDIRALIARGTIVPGDSAASPLVQRMRDGSMPPAGSSLVRPVTSGEIALVASFVDQLPATPAAACDPLAFLSSDDVYAALLADAQAAPPQDRPFFRYVGLTYASNAGLCGPALERQRSALFKLVNSVSTAPEIHVPRAVGDAGVLYRIDLRDYRWDRAIDREDDGRVDFADGWLAIAAAAAPYAIELQGPDADALKRLTGAAVPFLPANALVHAATAGDLYYALIGLRLDSDATRAALGADVETLEPEHGLALAGFEYGGSRNSLVTRVEQSSFPGRYYYWLLSDQDASGDDSIFEDPFGFRRAGDSQVIFQLPNGLQAYEMDSPSNTRLPIQSLACVLEDCERVQVRNAADCHACHSAGLLSVTDQVRSYVESEPTQFDRNTLAAVRQYYPGATEFDQLLQQDSQLHLDAAARAGVSAGGPEPISFVYFQFELAELGLRRAAAELGVKPEALSAVLDSPSSRLGPLLSPDGKIDRFALDAAYVATRCALDADARNRPVACP